MSHNSGYNLIHARSSVNGAILPLKCDANGAINTNSSGGDTTLHSLVGTDTSDTPLSLTALTRVQKDVIDSKLGSIQTFLDKDSGVNFVNNITNTALATIDTTLQGIDSLLGDIQGTHSLTDLHTKLNNLQTINDGKLSAIQNFLDKDHAQFIHKHHTTSNLIGNELADGTGAVRHATIDSNGRVKVIDQYSSTLSGYLETIRNNTNILRAVETITTNSSGANLSGVLADGVATASVDMVAHKHIHLRIDITSGLNPLVLEGSDDNTTFYPVVEVTPTTINMVIAYLHKITDSSYRYYRVKNSSGSPLSFTSIKFRKLNL
tara:strand:- start:86 stop:1045 length:960 start_codon:yes stop_codon:yes gene_type:complete